MKVAVPTDSEQKIGGGWTFKRNLEKGLRAIGVDVIEDPLQADIALIAGVTMVSKETHQNLQDHGVKTIVRLDNVPRNSRNRGSGTSRLKSFARQASEVVWQGEWAKWYLSDFIGREGKIIHNGLDLDIFKPEGNVMELGSHPKDIYLYSRSSRDETKRWEQAWYEYQLIQRDNEFARLIILGKFSHENLEYDFDFFRGEQFQYMGIIENEMLMAELLRACGHLLATYSNDAFSNSYLEALCTGVELYKPDMSGGTPEMIDLFNTKGRNYFSLERMAQDYMTLFTEVLNR